MLQWHQFYPLANYVWEFFDDSFAYDAAGTLFYPGSTSATTAIVTMLADDGSTPISYPLFYGTAGNQGALASGWPTRTVPFPADVHRSWAV